MPVRAVPRAPPMSRAPHVPCSCPVPPMSRARAPCSCPVLVPRARGRGRAAARWAECGGKVARSAAARTDPCPQVARSSTAWERLASVAGKARARCLACGVCTLHTARCLHIARRGACTLCGACILHTARRLVHIARWCLHIAHCTLSGVRCLHIAHCTVPSARCTLRGVCVLHTARCLECTLHSVMRAHCMVSGVHIARWGACTLHGVCALHTARRLRVAHCTV
ncbi:hypothetical protein BASA81_017963 [Batrachochytrium salamandrivorans]|nr:hypothetical protein BASA81_017963 [Batrachochytrium salamandrivorans]